MPRDIKLVNYIGIVLFSLAVSFTDVPLLLSVIISATFGAIWSLLLTIYYIVFEIRAELKKHTRVIVHDSRGF